MNPRGQWYTVGTGQMPTWTLPDPPKRRIVRGAALPARCREVGPGETVGRSDAVGGSIHLMLYRTAGQSAGVTAVYPIPAMEGDLLGELVSLGVGPDPERRPGRREHIGVVALAQAGAKLRAMGPDDSTFRFGLPMFEYPGQRDLLTASAPKVVQGERWELRVTTDLRSAGYAIIVTMQMIEPAWFERLRLEMPSRDAVLWL